MAKTGVAKISVSKRHGGIMASKNIAARKKMA
jgi:hypothetical protein